MADQGLKISKENIDVSNATGDNILLDINKPLHKLDVTNTVSFQNLLVIFNNEPPNPDGVTSFSLDTEIYKFKHGYSYIPCTWFLYQNLTPNSVGSVEYAQYGGQIASPDAGSSAYLYYYIDPTYFHIVVRKNYQFGVGIGVTSIIGYRLRLRIYVFAEDIGYTG